MAPDVVGSRVAVGSFVVEIDGRGVRVMHDAAPAGVAWSTPPGKAFVAAVAGEMSTVGVAGHLDIVERVAGRYADQTIAAVDTLRTTASAIADTTPATKATAPPTTGPAATIAGGGESLTLAGSLSDSSTGASGRTVGYTLTLTSIDEVTLELALQLEASQGGGALAATGSSGAPQLWAELAWTATAGSAKFGFGEQFTHVDLAGRRVPILTAEQGVGRGAQPLTLAAELFGGAGGYWWSTYAPAAFLLSSDLRALYLTDTAPMQFDLRRDESSSVLVYRSRLTARVVAGASPAQLIEGYTRFAGRMQPLPDWVHAGAIIGMQGGEEKVRKVVAGLKRHGAPLAGVWLQDWVGNRKVPFGQRLWWDWQRNPDTYPNWDGLLQDLKADGLEALVYVNPFLSETSGRPGGRPDLFSQGDAGSHFVKDASGRTYLTDQGDFEAGMVDLSDAAAREWYLETLTEQIHASGALGWMADFGEGLPFDAVVANGEALDWHNDYPQRWAEFNRDLRRRLAARSGRDERDYVAFFRSGFSRSPATASLFWLGDQTVTWDEHDGLRSALTGLLSSGFSGYSLQHGDVGGYTSTVKPLPRRVRSRELLARWGELMAFTVVLRSHEGNRPALNVQVYSSEETLADFALAARLHAAWQGLRSELMTEAAASGLPVVRHPWLAYPDDPATLSLTSQFFLGRDVLVAPVVRPGHTTVSAYLPEGSGSWVHAFAPHVAEPLDPAATFAAGAGRWVEVTAPLGRPGVFVRQNAARAAELLERLRSAVRLGTTDPGTG